MVVSIALGCGGWVSNFCLLCYAVAVAGAGADAAGCISLCGSASCREPVFLGLKLQPYSILIRCTRFRSNTAVYFIIDLDSRSRLGAH